MQCENGLSLLEGAALGAVTMYFFDPEQGRQRRAACMGEVNQLLRWGSSDAGHNAAAGQPTLRPATRVLFGAVGAGLFAWGLTQRAPTACLLGSLGLAFTWPAAVGHGPGAKSVSPTPTVAPSDRSDRGMTERQRAEISARNRERSTVM